MGGRGEVAKCNIRKKKKIVLWNLNMLVNGIVVLKKNLAFQVLGSSLNLALSFI